MVYNFKRILKRLFNEVFWWSNKKLFQKYIFWKTLRYWPNIENPTTINEILLELKLRSCEGFGRYVDKIKVRDFVNIAIFEYNLVKLRIPKIYSLSETVDDFIDEFEARECFIKANHGSGMCLFFNASRSELDYSEIKVLRKWIKTNYFKFTGEKCYTNISRKIFAEETLRTKSGSFPDDIKVHCYNGKPAVIQFLRRTSGELQRKTFDEKWVEKNWFQNEVLEIELNEVPRSEIIEYSKVLATGFEYVRVDFYLVDDLLYFSELTFFPASATLPLVSRAVDQELGEKYEKFKKSPLVKNLI